MTATFKPEPEVPAGAPCYAPSPTVEEFIYAVAGGPVTEFRLLMLTSSRGEGKSSGAIFALLALAERVRRDGKGSLLPLRVAVVRDTWVNLSRTTIATFEKQHRMGLDLTWRDGQREAIVPGQLHFFFFGMDNRADVDKLQGFEAAVLWLEEVAPGAELTQGIPAETLGIGRTSLRQEGVPKRILMTFNPPDEDHWPLWHGTPVLTPTGWVKIGDLRPGDAVVAGDGTATEVTGVYPRGVQPLYRVKFSDGSSALCTDEHPWGIESKRDRSGKTTCNCRSAARCRRRKTIRVVTTGQIRRRLEVGPRHYRWNVPLVGAVEFSRQPVPLDPYVVGALLGDGSLTSTQVGFCSADPEIVDQVRAGLPPKVYLRHLRNYDYVLLSEGGHHTPNPINRAIKALGLHGHSARTKFVPDVYLWNSPEIRLALLQGLLDTDGHASRDGNSVSFASISERLIEDVEFLVRSLGGVTRRRAKGRIGPRRPHELYVLGITLPDGVMPFRLSRKNARLSPKSKRHQPRRYIVGCDPCGEGEAVCISVAHQSRLFVCDHFVVTHNSLKVEEHLANLNMANLVVHRFWIPPGERSAHFRSMALRAARSGNFALARQWEEAAEEFDTYREQNIAFLESIGRHDLVARLGKGEIGGVQIGEAVMSTFSHKLHVTEPGEKLIALPGSQMWRAWDAGLTPSCVWVEETPSGNLNVHGSRTSINKSITQHVLDEVIPFQEKSGLRPKRAGAGYDGRKGWDYRDCGDPAFFAGDSVQDAEYSAGLALQHLLHTTLEVPPTNDWPPRRDAGLVAFQRKGQGPRMLIRIQREENQVLIQGLNGRAHYVVNMATGGIDPSVKTAKKASGIFFQALDALLYFLVLKFPAHDWLRREPGPGSPKPALPEPKDWLGI